MHPFKERLTARRNALNLSQAQLAHDSGVSERAIAGYESTENRPSMRIVEKLATALQVTPSWLMGGQESQFKTGEPPVPNQVMVAELLAAIDRLQAELHTIRRQAERLKAEAIAPPQAPASSTPLSEAQGILEQAAERHDRGRRSA